jgi:hypothetical protein
MLSSAIQARDWFDPTSYTAPAALPVSGDWTATLGSLGNADYFWFDAQANRTLSVEVTALDDSKAVSELKAQPVIGMWALADPETFPAPGSTRLAFNSTTFGNDTARRHFADKSWRSPRHLRLPGDGRPDYRYRGRVFYADNETPARARVDGNTTITVQGVGFHRNTTATVAAANAPVLAVSANQVIATAAATVDGVQSITL